MKKTLTRRDFLTVSGSVALATALAGCSFGVGQQKASSGGNSATVWDITTGEQQSLDKDVVKKFNSSHKSMNVSI